MRDMASKLDISLSYLSAIENGKRAIPNFVYSKVCDNYDLSEKDKERLNSAIAGSSDVVKIDFTSLSEKKKEVIYKLSTDQFDEDTMEKLYSIVVKKED